MNTRINEFKSETVTSIDTILSAINSNKNYSSYDQPTADLIKLPLIKLTENSDNSSAMKFWTL